MKIVTHADFDGIVSAALVERCLGKAFIDFASPKTVAGREVTETDVVCDLPYPHRTIRYWFDHHEGNIETIQRLGMADSIAGRFEVAPSAVQVVYDFFKDDHKFPAFIDETVRWSNIVDSMDYPSVEAWLEPTPAHRINRAIYMPGERYPDARRFMLLLARTAAKHPLETIADSAEVDDRYQVAKKNEDEAVELIRRIATLEGPGEEIALLDLSAEKSRPTFSKNMAYTVYPNAKAILQLLPAFDRGVKANSVRVSFSLNPFGEPVDHDVAQILEALELGSGHKGAAGGGFEAASKDALAARKKQVLAQIYEEWAKQSGA